MVVKTRAAAEAAAAPAAAAPAAASIYQQVQLIGEVSIFQNPTYFNYVALMGEVPRHLLMEHRAAMDFN